MAQEQQENIRGHKLLPKDLEAAFPPLYSTEGVPLEDKKIVAKYFTPDANWTWYAVEGGWEGDEDDRDFIFFGLVDGLDKEWGNFSLMEMLSVNGPMGLPIERDLHFHDKQIKDVM